MNNLTTRKIVLGLLMTLVLAFSVQGIADAIDSFSNPSDSNGTAAARHYPVIYDDAPPTPEHTFSFRVNGAEDGDRVTVAPTNAAVTKMTVAKVATNEEGDPTSGTTTGTTITFDAPNSDTDDEGTDISVGEGESDTWSWSGIVTVTYTASAYGRYGLTVSGTTLGGVPPTSLSFNGYVVQGTSNAAQFRYMIDKSDSTTTPQITNTGDSAIQVEVVRGAAAQEWTQVDLSITGGNFYLTSGSLYLSNGRLHQAPGFTELTRLSVFTEDGVGTIPDVRVRPNSNTTAKVTAKITGAPGINATHVVTYFYSNAVTIKRISGNHQFGSTNKTSTVHTARRLTYPLVVSVLDGPTNRVSGQDVRFAIGGGGGAVLRAFSSALLGESDGLKGITSDDDNRSSIIVKTDGSGNAKVYLVPGKSAEEYMVTVSNPVTGVTTLLDPDEFTFTATATAAVRGGADLKIDKDHTNTTQSPQRDAKFGTVNNPLAMSVVIRTDNVVETLSENVQVNFQINGGRIYLAPATLDLTQPDYQTLLTTVTDSSGIATVYVEVNNGATATVTAQIVGNNSPRGRYTVTYFWGDPNYDDDSGGGRSDPLPPTNTITISPSSTTGEPGEEVTIRVTSSPSGALVTLGSNDFGATRFSPQSDVTPFTSTLLLPVEEGTHTFFATGGTFTAGRASVTVEAELGELSITAIGTPEAGLQTFSISAVDADGDRASAPFTARLSGTGFTSRNVEISGGRGNARVTLPTAARLYTLTVSATGYEDGETPVRIAGTGQQQVADEDEEEVEEEVTVAAEPDSIEITGPSTRSGTVNEELDTPLLVRVLDDDGDGLEGARVFYRVSSGRGRLSARGNGRAIGVVTDDDGYARASFTPLDGGTITVRANTDDLSATVTFTITTGSAPTTTRGPGTGVASSTSVNPVVHVAAASRPPMLWVDGGAIYALVGASPQRFAASVDNALNITVAGGKVYWTEKTGESGGTINSANLNGSGVTELASIFATPMGIAVDVTNSKLYWTNSAGRIQSANLDGSRITNVIPGGLETPMDLALAGGNAYWTQGGNVRFVNLRGTKQIRNISTGTDTAGSLAIGGGKVYWTETTGGSGGTVNSANLNGTGATQLASILAAPIGIAVDGSRSKLYWSNARGRIQSANLDGSKITNVVSGLGSPGELVLSNSIAMPTAAATTTTTTTASNAKYDVNSDGLVDNTDAGLVADAMGTSNARYDVNGDGTVNFLDLLLVFDNRDPGAAGAPTIVGMKMSAAQIDIIEEQIDLLIATNDRSPSAMRVLVYLQQLLVTARPEKTQLLANYPNPFNPETWIPYELATDTNVRLTIYNTQGVVIRTLQFGHQSAGYYVGRDRAAYWDGRNALGEQVASGLYFYQLETDEMSLMRKMVILK